MPTSPSIVPMLFTGNEMTELPEPADFSRVPALLNDVPVAPLLFCKVASDWKSKVAPASLLIVVMMLPALPAVMFAVLVSRIVPVLFSVPVKLRLEFPAIVSVPALASVPAKVPPVHSLPLPEADNVAAPFNVPLANVRSPLTVRESLTVSVPPQVLSMTRAPMVSVVSTMAVPAWLWLEVKSAVSKTPGTPEDQLPALLQLSLPVERAAAPVQ